MKLIKCFSNIAGHKEAQDLVNDLNAMKSISSDPFYIEYDRHQNYAENDNYLVVGNVTQKDWDELNLDMDFMKADLI